MTAWRTWLLLALPLGCNGNVIEVMEAEEAPGSSDSGTTEPSMGNCWEPGDCTEGSICHPDGLCRLRPSSCEERWCGEDPKGNCACEWSCSDGHHYATRCRKTPTGLVTCNCEVDWVGFPWTCVVEESTTDICGMGTPCCGFP